MEEVQKITANRVYKDRLLNFIFGNEDNREWTLSLYNAINNSDYADSSLIEFNTLKDVLYLNMRNDTSFLIYDRLNLYEHQSTYNPNMPFRMMEYICELYSGYIAKYGYNKYGATLIRLPIPKLVVFYNGTMDLEDERYLKLSDSFDEAYRDEADIEVTVRMLNINHGRNERLMRECNPLAGYAWFINEVRLLETDMSLGKAIDKAISDMPKYYELRGFLTSHRAEVVGMLDREYNEAEVAEMFREEGRREGRISGINDMIANMLQNGKSVDEIADFCGYPIERVEAVEHSLVINA